MFAILISLLIGAVVLVWLNRLLVAPISDTAYWASHGANDGLQVDSNFIAWFCATVTVTLDAITGWVFGEAMFPNIHFFGLIGAGVGILICIWAYVSGRNDKRPYFERH